MTWHLGSFAEGLGAFVEEVGCVCVYSCVQERIVSAFQGSGTRRSALFFN